MRRSRRRTRGSAPRSRAPARSAPRCECSCRTGRRRSRSIRGSTSTPRRSRSRAPECLRVRRTTPGRCGATKSEHGRLPRRRRSCSRAERYRSMSLALLLLVFAGAAAAVWVAGVHLSNTTDVLDHRLGFGEALGGLIFLAIATNLPEIAITASAALSHNLGIAIGNILGGIAIQTVVLVIMDAFGLRRKDALTYRAASLQLVLEGVLVVSILVIAIMGTQLPKSLIFARLAPGDLLIAGAWVAGLWLVNKARTALPWQEKGRAPDTAVNPKKQEAQNKREKWSTSRVIIIFIIAAVVTLIAGGVLEESGSASADHIGL